ncbi:MAG: hypothetical protein GF317_04135 [Candidatus Lokiarchaeota archaeon]|nr:hypothetical protein [Candidatus Lokiarchaeota archaeon]MBD3199076.1 hypothetical protein [Candidatus Lokiarchaeota archaeon]
MTALDPNRFYMLYIYQGALLFFCLIIIYKILTRSKKRLNIIFSMVYVWSAIGLILNMIFAFIVIEEIVLVLDFLTNFSVAFAPIFLVIFNLILLKSEKYMNTPKQLLIIVVYAIVLFLKIFLFLDGGVIINESTDWFPLWNLPYLIYVIVVSTLFSTIPILYTSYKIYRRFTDDGIKRRWKFFIGGVIGLILYMDFVFIANHTTNIVISIGLSISLLGIFFYIYAMYYGVGRQLK